MADVNALKGRMEKLPTSDKLRLAAELLDAYSLDIAETLAQRALDEMASGNVTRKPK